MPVASKSTQGKWRTGTSQRRTPTTKQKTTSVRALKAKNQAQRTARKRALVPGKVPGIKPYERTSRATWQVQREQGGINVKHVIDGTKAAFPKEPIMILDEGCGKSTLAEENQREGIHWFRTDQRPIDNKANFHQVPVHDLAGYFKGIQFHLIFSTFGGVAHSTTPERAIANVYEVLAVGGKAYISGPGEDHAQWKGIARKLEIPFRSTTTGIIISKRKPAKIRRSLPAKR
tara:strand:+ start:226 stop:918 length:693 start_codon:yes stop_codon:yes gene_type:complete